MGWLAIALCAVAMAQNADPRPPAQTGAQDAYSEQLRHMSSGDQSSATPVSSVVGAQQYESRLRQASDSQNGQTPSAQSSSGDDAYRVRLCEMSGGENCKDGGNKQSAISDKQKQKQEPAGNRRQPEAAAATSESTAPAQNPVPAPHTTSSQPVAMRDVTVNEKAEGPKADNQQPAAGVAPASSQQPAASSCVDDYCRELRRLASGTAQPPMQKDPEFSPSSRATTVRNFAAHLAADQVQIWSSPFRLNAGDLKWAVPFAGITTGLLVTDRTTSFELSRGNHVRLSNHVADYGVAGLGAGTAGLYLLGKIDDDTHQQEAGMLMGEAAIDSVGVDEVFKYAFGRQRPNDPGSSGKFFSGGSSFYSAHSTVAFSVASVLASEYPGWLTDIGAYGAATAISLSRVSARQHYPSDIFVGATLGYLIGKHVYHAHHIPGVGGSYGTFQKEMAEPLTPENTASTYVPLDSWIYPALGRLAAMGVIRTEFLGLRPWTRLAIAQMLSDASDRDAVETAPQAAGLIESLRSEFADELGVESGSAMQSIRLESVYTRLTGISGPPLNDSYHFGQTLINDFGRPYQRGFNEISGFTSRAETGRFAFYVRGEYQHAPGAAAYPLNVRTAIAQADANPLQPPTPVAAANQFRLLDTYVATSFLGNQISVGKQSLWWGPDYGGAMLMSDNAEPIYMLRINRTTPLYLPGLSRFLGPFRYDNVFGKLSGHSFPRDPFYYAQKVSFKPTENLELGFSRSSVFAGQGVTPLTFHTFVNSLTSLSSGTTAAGLADLRNNPGARLGSFDFSYRIPGLRNWLTLYSDSAAHDDVSPIDAPRRASINPGLYLSHFPKMPKLDFRVEAVSTDPPTSRSNLGQFLYYESIYHDAQTNKGYLLGDWIGREGKGGQAWITYWLSPMSTIQVGYRNAKVAKDFIPFGETQNDYFIKSGFRLRNDLEIDGMVQFESWVAPLLATGRQENVTSSFQLTFWPKNRLKARQAGE